MFNFTTERVLNTMPKIGNREVKDVYELIGVRKEDCSVKAYKRAYDDKAIESVTFALAASTYDVTRLVIELAQDNARKQGEWQNALSRNKKVIIVETTKQTVSDLGASFAAGYADQVRDSRDAKVTIANAAGTLTITACDEYTRILSIREEGLIETLTGGESAVEIKAFDRKKTAPTTAGRVAFGDAKWLVENFRLPTADHTYWLATHQDERPMPNGKYDQYTFIVEADRSPLTGLGAVGQKLTSVTTHVFYVEQGVKTFADLFVGTGITADEVEDIKGNTDEGTPGVLDQKGDNAGNVPGKKSGAGSTETTKA